MLVLLLSKEPDTASAASVIKMRNQTPNSCRGSFIQDVGRLLFKFYEAELVSRVCFFRCQTLNMNVFTWNNGLKFEDKLIGLI